MGYHQAMKEKLKDHFMRIGPRRFVVGTVIILILLDILNGIYLKQVWGKNDEALLLQVIRMIEVNPADFDQATMAEMRGLIDKSFSFMLFSILLNNLFFYLFYLRKKLWAQGFVLFYTLTAAIFSAAMIFDGFTLGIGWFIFNLLTIPVYLYLYAGVKLLKKETTLEPEKKAR